MCHDTSHRAIRYCVLCCDLLCAVCAVGCGAVVLWCCGAVMLWCCGAVVLCAVVLCAVVLCVVVCGASCAVCCGLRAAGCCAVCSGRPCVVWNVLRASFAVVLRPSQAASISMLPVASLYSQWRSDHERTRLLMCALWSTRGEKYDDDAFQTPRSLLCHRIHGTERSVGEMSCIGDHR